MSLINQTLKDLDKRRQGPGSDDLPIQISHGVEITAIPPKSSVTKPLLIVGVVVILGAAYWGMQNRKTPAQTEASAVATPTVAIPIAITATQPAAIQTAKDAATAQVVTPAPAPTAKPSITPNPVSASANASNSAPAMRADPPASAAQATTPTSTPNVAAVNKSVTPAQQAENLYRQAITSLRGNQEEQGRDQLRKALALNPNHHDARQLLARALIDARQPTAARTVLQEGLALSPQRTGFYMAIAHSHIQFNEIDPAISALQKGLPYAGVDAEYNALLAALYQRKSQHEDAARHYLVALRQSPDTANWLVGLGISLQATKNNSAAAEAFQRALDLGGLSPALTATAQEQLKKLTGRP